MIAICGLSSGGICAFTTAWDRPDYFSKVMSHYGSFTNIRGGHNYEALIRKTPKKNINLYLQDGSNDLNNEHGNWWLANQQMASSLDYKSYDYTFVVYEQKNHSESTIFLKKTKLRQTFSRNNCSGNHKVCCLKPKTEPNSTGLKICLIMFIDKKSQYTTQCINNCLFSSKQQLFIHLIVRGTGVHNGKHGGVGFQKR